MKFVRMILRTYRIIVGSWHKKRLEQIERAIEKEWGITRNNLIS